MKVKTKTENTKHRLTTKRVLKGDISKAPIAQIPKSKFENALNLLKASKEKENWMEACSKYNHAIQDKKHDVTKNINGRFLAEARICLLKRDWTRLAKILSVVKPVSTQYQFEYFPTYLKYAAICLYYNHREDLLDDFLKGVCLRNDNNQTDFFRALTSFPS